MPMGGVPCVQIEERASCADEVLNASKNSAAGGQAFARPADDGSLAPALTLPYNILNLKDSFTVTH